MSSFQIRCCHLYMCWLTVCCSYSRGIFWYCQLILVIILIDSRDCYISPNIFLPFLSSHSDRISICNWAYATLTEDHICQTPLQLSMTTWQSLRQCDVRGREMCNFWDMSLKSETIPLPPVYFHLACYNTDSVASHLAWSKWGKHARDNEATR